MILADSHSIETAELSLSSKILVAVEYFIFAYTVLVLLAFNFDTTGKTYISAQQNNSSTVPAIYSVWGYSGAHRKIYSLLMYSFTMEGITFSSQTTFLFILFLISATVFYYFFISLYEHFKFGAATQSAKSCASFCGKILAFKVPFGFLVLTCMSSQILHTTFNISSPTWLETSVSVLAATTLIILPMEVFLLVLQTYDYQYIRTNYLQSKSYRYFIWSCTLSFSLSIWRYFSASLNNQYMDLFGNLLGFILAAKLILLSTGDLIHFQSGHLNSFVMLINSILATETAVCFLVVAFPFTLTKIPFDLVVPIIIIACWLCQLSCTKDLVFDKLTEYLFDILETTEKVATYYELLYDCFLKQKNKYYRYLLHLAFIGHNIHCKDPRCLCFLVNEDLEPSNGLRCGKHARDIYLSYTASRDFESNGLVTFDDQNIQKKYFQRHNTLVISQTDTATKKVRLLKADKASRSWVTQLNLRDPTKFKLLMCSLYKSFYKWNYQSGELFVIVMSFARFLLSEYQNKIAVLLFLSEYKNSVRYTREASVYKSALLENITRLAQTVDIKRATDALTANSAGSGTLRKMVDLSSNSAVSSLNLKEVLDLTKSIELLSKQNRKVIAQKLKLYDLLISHRIPYKSLVKHGFETRKQIVDVEMRISKLLQPTDNNIKVLREALIFEVCVQERSHVSPGLQEKYRSVVTHKKTRGYGEHHKDLQQHTLKFSSSNVVLFTQRQPSGFVITQTTTNAERLLGTHTQQPDSRSLSQFLPQEFDAKACRLDRLFRICS